MLRRDTPLFWLSSWIVYSVVTCTPPQKDYSVIITVYCYSVKRGRGAGNPFFVFVLEKGERMFLSTKETNVAQSRPHGTNSKRKKEPGGRCF